MKKKGQEEVGRYDLGSFIVLKGKRPGWVRENQAGARAEKKTKNVVIEKSSRNDRGEVEIDF